MDVDGVLLNWQFAFTTYLGYHGHFPDPEKRFSYYLEEQYGLTVENIVRLIYNFNHSPSIGTLPALRDAVHWVPKFKEEGFDLHIISAVSDQEWPQKARKANLEKLFGPIFSSYQFVGLGQKKAEILESYKDSNYFWLEDKYEEALTGKKFGLNVALMEHSYNLSVTDIPRVRNWQEYYHYVQTGALGKVGENFQLRFRG
jgi:hypothetical protein